MQTIIVLLFRNSIYNNVGCNNHSFVFLTSGHDCNSGMQKRIHFRTDMEQYICRPVNNSDVSLGYQFCKNISFILYIIYNVRYNKTSYSTCKKSREVNIIFQSSSRHIKIEIVFPNYLKSSSQSSSG